MRSRLPTYRRSPAPYFLCVLVAAALVVPARGQFSGVWGADEVQVGQNANLFARWEGRSPFEGAFVELPPRWTLKEAVAVRQGYRQRTLKVRRLDEISNVYGVASSEPLLGPHDLVLHVETGGLPGRADWTLTPFVFQEERGRMRLVPRSGFRITRAARQVAPAPATDNRVLAFRGNGPPLLLRRSALPDLGARASYTLECWIRTTDLNEVILSTWNGEEHAPYPLELVVDAGGRLRYYRGQPGRHESMATLAPVADGQWHHLALTHDAYAGWTRLFLDGLAADSLYSPAAPPVYPRLDLALGARLPSLYVSADALGGYTGLLDELRLWPQARPAAAVRRTMREPLQATAGTVILGFEEPIPAELLAQRAARVERIASDLVFYQPVQYIQAVPEGEGVHLTWETKDTRTRAFILERSSDGRAFVPVGEVNAADATRRDDEARAYAFHDPYVTDQVVFYRIRQRFESGAERLSGAIKLGLGRQVQEEGAVLLGNFPNPFNPATTIGYEVRQAQRVRVSVWDLKGQQVAVLVDRVHQPGYYEVRFDATDLPSGTYFVRMQTRRGTLTHQMVLTK